MIGIATYFYGSAFQVFTDPTEITVTFILIRRMYELFPVFRAEDDVDVVLYE